MGGGIKNGGAAGAGGGGARAEDDRAVAALASLLRPHAAARSEERAEAALRTAALGAALGALSGAAWGGFREVRGIRHELQVSDRVRLAAARASNAPAGRAPQPLSQGLFSGYKMQSLRFMAGRAARGAGAYGGAAAAYALAFDWLRYGGVALEAAGLDTAAARGADGRAHCAAAALAFGGLCGAVNASLRADSAALRAGRGAVGLAVGGAIGAAVGHAQTLLHRWAEERRLLEEAALEAELEEARHQVGARGLMAAMRGVGTRS